MECAELAPAFQHPSRFDSASELDALHTLREVGKGQAPVNSQVCWVIRPKDLERLDVYPLLNS